MNSAVLRLKGPALPSTRLPSSHLVLCQLLWVDTLLMVWLSGGSCLSCSNFQKYQVCAWKCPRGVWGVVVGLMLDMPSRGGGVCPSGSAGSSGLQDALRCCGSVEALGRQRVEAGPWGGAFVFMAWKRPEDTC